jgi:hypothetical protein
MGTSDGMRTSLHAKESLSFFEQPAASPSRKVNVGLRELAAGLLSNNKEQV